ncbi:MAG: hypothetical protein RLZZ517_383 [Candidatus Parcubacteria bacterium]|jgi:hypothetical protein
MKTIKAKSPLDNELLERDVNYPICGNFLDKYKYLNNIIETQENILSKDELLILKNELERLNERVIAEGGSKIQRFIQYIFSLYPYEEYPYEE